MQFNAIAFAVTIVAATNANALPPATQPATQPAATVDLTGTQIIDLWPKGALKNEPAANTEVIENRADRNGVPDRRITKISHPTLTRFSPASATQPLAAVVVIPGGGYSGEMFDREGYFIAEKLRAAGIAAFVLKYRLPVGVAPAADEVPVPIQDVQRAVRLLRANAGQWSLDPSRIGVMGFSAGGHVAGMAATRFDLRDPNATDDVAKQSARPDFAVLMYAVSSMHEDVAHAGSRKNLLGEHPGAALEKQFSVAECITPNTPPLFVVHAEDDSVVKIQNSNEVAAAAKAAGVPCEYVVFQTGGHGFGLARPNTEPAAWFERFLHWLPRGH